MTEHWVALNTHGATSVSGHPPGWHQYLQGNKADRDHGMDSRVSTGLAGGFRKLHAFNSSGETDQEMSAVFFS